jgi:hypothetical protein
MQLLLNIVARTRVIHQGGNPHLLPGVVDVAQGMQVVLNCFWQFHGINDG